MLTRFLPKGLTGRFVLLLAVALVIANAVAALLITLERGRIDRAEIQSREIERVVSLVAALEAVSPADRRPLTRRASSRSSRLVVNPRPYLQVTPADEASQDLARLLTERLPDREIRAAVFSRNAPPPGEEGRRGDALMAASVRLENGTAATGGERWLNLVSFNPGRRRPGLDEELFFFILGLSLLSVLGVGYLFARRLTRPLAELAEAARSAGTGDRSVRVREEGPVEFQEAAAAFNEMQSRIARFDAERLRTLAAVGHDLRTPLTSLRIRAEMLDEETAEPMIRTLDELAVMADSLVSYAKGSDGAEDTVPIALGAWLETLCKERGATLDIRRDATVTGRPVALKRSIANLIDNALRYGGEANVTLDQGDGQAIITVEDNGPGIAEEQLHTVFEPFVRGDHSRGRESGGVGLGLSIARTIILAHGGTIELANRAPKGLAVTVRLAAAAPV